MIKRRTQTPVEGREWGEGDEESGADGKDTQTTVNDGYVFVPGARVTPNTLRPSRSTPDTLSRAHDRSQQCIAYAGDDRTALI